MARPVDFGLEELKAGKKNLLIDPSWNRVQEKSEAVDIALGPALGKPVESQNYNPGSVPSIRATSTS